MLHDRPQCSDMKCFSDIFYNDFFEPLSGRPTTHSQPSPQKLKSNRKSQVRFHEEVRVKKIKPNGKNRSLHDDDDEDDDEEDDFYLDAALERQLDEESQSGSELEGEDYSEEDSENEFSAGTAIQRLKQDLFDDDSDEEQDGTSFRFSALLGILTNFLDMTTHERRIAEIKEQIQQLEAENVGQKEWMLLGEAGTRQRPQNSLLEEDLDFDRVQKAVPVITEEEVKTLEDKIKARILEGRFDDVIRIRAFEDKPFLPSRLLELQDAKSKESLAQLYENDYMAAQTGEKLPDDRDGKLQKEHDAIDGLWEKICGKLDALSNAHFVPKQVSSYVFRALFALLILYPAKGNHIQYYQCPDYFDGICATYIKIGGEHASAGRGVFLFALSIEGKE